MNPDASSDLDAGQNPGSGVSVVCECFAGPLDVLLALVRRHRYPPERLPIAEITRLFLEWLQRERGQNEERVAIGGDFIETASWLVLLKSRTLLPRAEAEEAPEAELRRVLVDHETMRAATAVLGERLAEVGFAAGDPAAAPPPRMAKEVPARSVESPTLADALDAARRALLRAQAHRSTAPESDLFPVEEQIATVRERIASLPRLRGVSTEEWFAEQPAPEARVALLLALLELARVEEILLHQPFPASPILLARCGPNGPPPGP